MATNYETAKAWYAKGPSKWTDDYFDADKGKGRRQSNTRITRSGLEPLDAPTLHALFVKHDADARQRAWEGLTAHIEDRTDWWYRTRVKKHKAGMDADDAVMMGHLLLAKVWDDAPATCDDFLDYFMSAFNYDLERLVSGARDLAKKVKADRSSKEVTTAFATLPARVDYRAETVDLTELLLYLADKLRERPPCAGSVWHNPDAVAILFFGRQDGKTHAELSKELGVSVSCVRRGLAEWAQEYDNYLEKISKKKIS